MPIVEIDTVGAIGLIKDEEPYKIDTAAWSEAFNVRFQDGYAQSISGRLETFGGALVEAPLFLIPISTGSETVWVWASATKLYGIAGGVTTELTRLVGGDYTSSPPSDWNGVPFSGILVVNNGADVPQYWATPSVLASFADLPNWPSTYRAKVIRALGPYLVAINVAVSGTRYPHRVKWSHAADPGSVPDSWDYTDPTKDAGESELPDVNSGALVDALNLRGQLFLYKENATWRMRYIGGNDIFAFDSVYDSSGILAPRCVSLVGNGAQHFVATQDDLVVHDGQNIPQSVIGKKFRRYLFSQIDPDAYQSSFTLANYIAKEMWFCYPTVGESQPNRAVIWNWETGTLSETEVNFVAAGTGPIEATDVETWADGAETWDIDSGGWSSIIRRNTLVAVPSTQKVLQLGAGNTFDGTPPTVTLQRTGLALVGQRRDRSPIVDHERRKMVTRVFPRVIGGPVDIRLGAQDLVDGPIRWTDKVSYDPAAKRYVDLIVEGAAIAIEFSSHADVTWKLEGYKLDMSVDGAF